MKRIARLQMPQSDPLGTEKIPNVRIAYYAYTALMQIDFCPSHEEVVFSPQEHCLHLTTTEIDKIMTDIQDGLSARNPQIDTGSDEDNFRIRIDNGFCGEGHGRDVYKVTFTTKFLARWARESGTEVAPRSLVLTVTRQDLERLLTFLHDMQAMRNASNVESQAPARCGPRISLRDVRAPQLETSIDFDYCCRTFSLVIVFNTPWGLIEVSPRTGAYWDLHSLYSEDMTRAIQDGLNERRPLIKTGTVDPFFYVTIDAGPDGKGYEDNLFLFTVELDVVGALDPGTTAENIVSLMVRQDHLGIQSFLEFLQMVESCRTHNMRQRDL